MYSLLRPLFVLFVSLTAVTGIIYSLLTTGLGQVLFPTQTAGSLQVRDGKLIGSALISQSFQDPK